MTANDVIGVLERLRERAGFPLERSLLQIGLARSTYYDWKRDGGKQERPPATTPKGHQITPQERAAMEDFARTHPEEGYRRLSAMMIDAGVAAVRPSTVYLILQEAGLIGRWKQPGGTPHKKGFTQPERPHEQWHSDIAYLNILGTQYFLISVLDGFSRAILYHDVRTNMETRDVEIVIQHALDQLPAGVPPPRIISDNGSQYISYQFKAFLRDTGCAHSRARVRHPQSNGKIERFHKTIKGECTRRTSFTDLDDARQVIRNYVEHYNTKRLHSAINLLTPADALRGPEHMARRLAERQEALKVADQQRRSYWNEKNSA